MALDPILWALKDAPVRSATERLVITIYAEHADEDGSNAYPSYATVAERALCDRKTVERTVGRLVERGLLGRGDQAAANAIPARYRPVVYDVLVPYSWWGERAIERVNRYREQRGRDPITPTSRRDPQPAPPRARRCDAGRPRTAQGGLSVPSDDSGQGGLSVPARGDSQSRLGGTESPPTLPSNPPHDPPLLPDAPADPSGDAVGGPGQAGRQDPDQDQDPGQGEPPPVTGDTPPDDQAGQSATGGDGAAAELLQGLPWPAGVRIDPGTRTRLVDATAACLTAGHPPTVVAAHAAGGIPGARQPAAVVLSRLRHLADTSPAPADVDGQDAAAAERDRLARTRHELVPGTRPGYCGACGRVESAQVHGQRHTSPASTTTGATSGRCEHGRRACVTCHSTGTGQTRPAPRQRTGQPDRPAGSGLAALDQALAEMTAAGTVPAPIDMVGALGAASA